MEPTLVRCVDILDIAATARVVILRLNMTDNMWQAADDITEIYRHKGRFHEDNRFRQTRNVNHMDTAVHIILG